MTRILKWIAGIFGALIALIVIANIYWIATGQSYIPSRFFEWRHQQLAKKLLVKTDATSLQQRKVLEACEAFFPQRPDDQYLCFKATTKDQKREWVFMHAHDETKPYGISENPQWATRWSANLTYSNERIYASRIAIRCEVDHFIVGWDLLSISQLREQSLEFQLGNNDKTSLFYSDPKSPNGVYMDRAASSKFISNAKKNVRTLKVWIPDENGVDQEFRFDISKLPKQLTKLEKACGLT